MPNDNSVNLHPTHPDMAQLPRINPFTMFRLGLVQMGLGIMAILMLGVLNRIMIQELAIPATIVGGCLAMYQFVAPVRIWFGQMSDAKTVLGYHRTVYIWSGAILFAILAFVAVQVVWQLNRSAAAVGWSSPTYGWVAFLAFIFALYGLCISATATPFFALMVDVSDEDNRGQLIGVVWSMLTLGIGLGAGISSALLQGVTLESLEPTVNRLFAVVPALVLMLVILATWGVEKKYSRLRYRRGMSPTEDSLTFGTAIQVLTASRQTGFFFVYLVLMVLGMFMQQPILEPYAGEVFGMTIAESTFLNTYWSLGSLASLGLSGFLMVPRLGKKRTAKLGCIFVASSFVLIVLAGWLQMSNLLRVSLVLFGLAVGVVSSGSISLMLDLTTAETAGTFTGLWGLAQAVAQALSTLFGGAILDLGRQLFAVPILAYGLVFGVEIVLLLGAIALLRRVDVAEFRTHARQAIATLVETDLS